MTKTVPLKNAVETVKSQLPATPPKREYADFDAFVVNADKLVAFFDAVWKDEERLGDIGFEWVEWPDHRPINLEEAKAAIQLAKTRVRSARYWLPQFQQARKRLAEFKRDEKWYDRKELYEVKGKGKRQKWTLSRRVVSEQIALLLASFQNSRPGTPKVFGRMLTEEVYAKNPNACTLESACRHVRREHDFPPSIAELLKAIKKESAAWGDRWETLDCDIDRIQQRLEKSIAKAEAKIAPAEAKLAEREAKARAWEEKCRLYREAYARIPEDERRAFEDGERARRFSPANRPSMPVEYLNEGRERELHAYRAGLAGERIPGLVIADDASVSKKPEAQYADEKV
jgi:hypothetical protein